MAKRTRIELARLQCPSCKKSYFSYLEKGCCPECANVKKRSQGLNDA
ncbi:MAG: hypothetical protein NHB14_19690 [Desulfosporosinus sp.]|nr:hypothetical protein [Desulfosporosinus sp.]